jgi:hypothetical protein
MRISFWIYATLAVLGLFLSCRHPFFWDTTQLASRQAQWFFDHRFHSLLLPAVIDSGHPPGFGMYLAFLWQLFGQSLPVSHFAVFPFILITIAVLAKLGDRLHPGTGDWLPLLIFVDPVFATQSTLVSPDNVVIAGFLLGLYGSWTHQRWLLVVGTLMLSATSMRGMMATAGLYVFEILAAEKKVLDWRFGLQKMLAYVPAGLLSLAFLLLHYQAKGWIGFHADSPWAPSFAKVGWSGLVRNAVVLILRLLDFGRIFLWLSMGIIAAIIWRYWQPFWKLDHVRRLSILCLVMLAMESFSFLVYRGVNLHRYLGPFFLSADILFVVLLLKSCLSERWKSFLFAFTLIGLISGHFWIYPPYIAQSWDTTLAHWPHYALRQKMIDYLDQKHIPLNEVGTAFPEIGPLHWRDLSQQQRGFTAKNLEQQSYIFYLRTMNDFSDAERITLFKDWKQEVVFQQGFLTAILFKKMD